MIRNYLMVVNKAQNLCIVQRDLKILWMDLGRELS